MEVKQAAFLGQQKTEILFGRDLGDLPTKFVRRFMAALGNAVISQFVFVLAQASLGDTEGLVDGIPQIRRLVFPLQMIRLVCDDNVVVTGHLNDDVDNRRHGFVDILIALIDPNAAARHAAKHVFKARHMITNGRLGGIG